MDRKLEIAQARFEEIDGSAGINRPDDAIILQLLHIFHAVMIEHGISAVRDKGAVEVGAKEADLGGHRTVT